MDKRVEVMIGIAGPTLGNLDMDWTSLKCQTGEICRVAKFQQICCQC